MPSSNALNPNRKPRSGGASVDEEDRLLALLGDCGRAVLAAGPEADVVVIAPPGRRRVKFAAAIVDALVRDDLAIQAPESEGYVSLSITKAGRARLARLGAPIAEGFMAQHARLRDAVIVDDGEARRVIINDGESTLAWLYRRKGPDGAPLISAVQFAAGERLRADLTRAQIMPRVTANWSAAVASGRRVADSGLATDVMIAARRRVDQALRMVGPEFAGLLIDVCGFLKRLPDIERERGWPARSGKLVLDMALTRLARHYGLETEATGPARSTMRSWAAAGYRPSIEGANG